MEFRESIFSMNTPSKQTLERSSILEVVKDQPPIPIMQQLEFHVETTEIQREDTLFSAASRPEFTPRKTEPRDVPILETFVTDETRNVFTSVDVGMVFEKSCFSMVLVDQIDDKVIAHASFVDIPMDSVINIDGTKWKSEESLYGINPLNTLFFHLFLIHKEYAPDSCLVEILANTFLACPAIDAIILECPDLEFEGSYLFTNLAPVVVYLPRPEINKKLILYEKYILFPHLIIREGREHDLDDLAPQLTITTNDMMENFNLGYLSDLIALADRNNQSIVAEFDNEAVGIAIVTTDIDYKFLNKNFHIEAFHGLFRPHTEDLINLEARQSTLLETVKVNETPIEDHFIVTPRRNRSRVFRREATSAEEMAGIEVKDSSENPGGSKMQVHGSQIQVGSKIHILHEQSKTKIVKSKVEFENESEEEEEEEEEDEEEESKVIQVEELFKALRQDPLATALSKSRIEGYEYDAFEIQFLKHKDSTEFDYEVPDKDIAQVLLLQRIDEIKKTLEDNNLTIETKDSTLKFLPEAEEFLKQCVNIYLHNVLIGEKLLPFNDWNEPQASVYVGLPNAIAIQLLTMDKRFHMRIQDLIYNTFLSFPNRDYVIITVSSHLPEPFWMKFFTCAVKRKDSTYPKSLYVLHRIAFNARLRVRVPNKVDFTNIKAFLSPIIGSSAIINDVQKALEFRMNPEVLGEDWRVGMLPFILEVVDYDFQNIVVGLALISNDFKPAYYQVNYNLDHYTYANYAQFADYGYINHFILSPIFQMHSRMFMKEILRRTRKHFAFHNLLPFYKVQRALSHHQSLLNNIEDWIPLVPRKRINYPCLNLKDLYDDARQPSQAYAQDYSFPHCALFFSKKFLFDPKPNVFARIVFIGGSKTAISALEKLIYHSHLVFKYLTIISTNGIPGSGSNDPIRNLFFPRTGGPSLSMISDDEWYKRLGIRNHVNIVYGTVTKLLRDSKAVVVNGRRIIHYDLLVICAGRQFIRPDCPEPEIEDEHFAKFQASIHKQIPSDIIEERTIPVPPAKPFTRFTVKPYNAFLLNNELDASIALSYLREYLPLNHQRHIIVHGSCLEAYCCINALIQLKIDLHRIVFVTTSDEEMDWEKYHGYKDTPKLKEVMERSFKRLNIRVLRNYEFRKWKVQSSSNLITRVYFKSDIEEVESMSISCLAYFPFLVKRVSDEIASVLTESFLPFTNGILIDTTFQTIDPNIWAAGPCTSYNKALCADKFFHGYYTSYEIGQLLGDLILKKFNPTDDIRIVNLIKPNQSLLPPLLTAPMISYAELPDGWFYFHLKRPGIYEKCCHGECTCADCECGTEIITGSLEEEILTAHKYFRLWLNSFQRVEGIECVSRIEFSPSNFAALYGHHETILNKLLDNVSRGDVNDLYTYFEQPWIAALCHDRWIDFREELQDVYSEFDIGPNIKIFNFIREYLDNLENPDVLKVDPNILRRIFEITGLKEKVERKFLEFLKYNRAVLPMYARPDYVQELYEEREVSPMYFPQIPNF